MKINSAAYPKKAGIYKLTCIDNGKIYIGKSVNLYIRIGDHRRCSTRKDGKYYFENALIKYGWNSFEVEILEVFENFNKSCSEQKEHLLRRETHYMELFDSTNTTKGYNICKFSTDMTGIPRSKETKEKISESKLGTQKTEETKDKIRQSKIGKPNLGMLGKSHTLEAKLKNRMSNLGQTRTEETREKIRQAGLIREQSKRDHKKCL